MSYLLIQTYFTKNIMESFKFVKKTPRTDVRTLSPNTSSNLFSNIEEVPELKDYFKKDEKGFLQSDELCLDDRVICCLILKLFKEYCTNLIAHHLWN